MDHADYNSLSTHYICTFPTYSFPPRPSIQLCLWRSEGLWHPLDAELAAVDIHDGNTGDLADLSL